MGKWWVNKMKTLSLIKFGIAIGLVYGLGLLISSDRTVPNSEFIPEMVHSVAYDSYAPNPNFADGKTLQMPPEGTIALGFMPEYPDGELPKENAGKVLKSPFDIETMDLARGAKVYATFCQVCHGLTGDGDGPVTKRGVPPPPSLKTDRVRNMMDGDIYYLISKGVGNMPPYSVQVKREDRWLVTHFIKTMK